MRSFSTIARVPLGTPLPAETVVESHAARILILVSEAGIRRRISGLTKLAKLDFFLRYPEFLGRIVEANRSVSAWAAEPTMIRFLYGPWDPRYYQVLPFLESRGLLAIGKNGRSYTFSLTDLGRAVVEKLGEDAAFVGTFEGARAVGKELGHMSGGQLKNLVYERFADEVAQLPLGQGIHHER